MKQKTFLSAVLLLSTTLVVGCDSKDDGGDRTEPTVPVITSNVLSDNAPVWAIEYDGDGPFTVSVTATGDYDLQSFKVETVAGDVTKPVETVTTFSNPKSYTYTGQFEVPDGETSFKIKFTAVNVKTLFATETFTLSKTDNTVVPTAPVITSNVLSNDTPVWAIEYDGDEPFTVSVTTIGDFDLQSFKVETVAGDVKTPVETITTFSNPKDYTYTGQFEVPGGETSIEIKFTALNVESLSATRTFTLIKTDDGDGDDPNELSQAAQALLLEAFVGVYNSSCITASGLPASITVGGKEYDKGRWFEAASRMMLNLINGTSGAITLSGYEIDDAANLSLDTFAQTEVGIDLIKNMTTQQLAWAADGAKGNGEFANTLNSSPPGATIPGRNDSHTLNITGEVNGLNVILIEPPRYVLQFTDGMPYVVFKSDDLQLDWSKDPSIFFSFYYRSNDAVPIPSGAIAFKPEGAAAADLENTVPFTIAHNDGEEYLLFEVDMTSVMKAHFTAWTANDEFFFVPFMTTDSGVFLNIYFDFMNFHVRVATGGVPQYSGELSLERGLIIMMRSFAYYKANGSLPTTISSSKSYVAL